MPIREQLNYYQERIVLGSISIPSTSLPFDTFLMGYFVGKIGCGIDSLFQFFDLLAELADQKLCSSLMKKQLVNLLQDFPFALNQITRGLGDYKNGKKKDLIGWIESFYSHREKNMDGHSIALNGAVMDGTLELQNSSHTDELNIPEPSQKHTVEKNEREDQDHQFARKLQEEMDNVPEREEEEVLCQICYCGLYDDPFEGLDLCGHYFHSNCMSQAFKTNILSNNFPIKCPNVECQKEVTEGDLKSILQKGLFQKYQNHTLKAYAEGHGQSISWCPTANCTYMFFFEKGDEQRFQCLECKKDYCLNCRVQWHKEMTCKEYKVSSTMSEDDQKFLEFARGKKFKQCPKCKFWVERSEGCDHMVCKCKFQFCYKCGGIYGKCECIQAFRKQQERNRQQRQEMLRAKAERKRLIAERSGLRREEKLRKQEQMARKKASSKEMATRASRRNKK